MREIITEYRVPSKFVCKLLGGSECISFPSPLEVAVCKETFQAGFHLPIYPFIEQLLARYKLVFAKIHPNVWMAIVSFMIKCVKDGLKPKMRTLRLVMALKVDPSGKSIVYTSYRSSALAFLISESL